MLPVPRWRGTVAMWAMGVGTVLLPSLGITAIRLQAAPSAELGACEDYRDPSGEGCGCPWWWWGAAGVLLLSSPPQGEAPRGSQLVPVGGWGGGGPAFPSRCGHPELLCSPAFL